jgi:fatty acid desaturase
MTYTRHYIIIYSRELNIRNLLLITILFGNWSKGAALNRERYTLEEDKSFLRRQVLTASNVGGSWLCFINSGLNYQIEHHLFPRIQHTHYPTFKIMRNNEKKCEIITTRHQHW